MKNTFIAVGVVSLFLLMAPHVEAAGGAQHHPNFFKELNLTDAQKQQIETIRSSNVDKKEKRQEMMAVLTADQKTQLKELRKEWRASHAPGSGPASTTPASTTTPPNPAPTVNGTVTPLPGVPVTQ